MRYLLYSIGLLTAFVSVSAGCTADSSAPTGALSPGLQANARGMPAAWPAEFPELPRHASYPPQELTQQGWEADLTLSNRSAAAEYPYLLLLPGAQAGDAGSLGACAFASFRFQVPALQEELKIHSFFSEETPPAPGTVYVGVANWWEERWDWYPWAEVVSVPELSAHKRLDDGTILVTFLQTSGELLKLSLVAVGERIHLRAQLFIDGPSFTVLQGAQVNFTAQANFIGSIDNVELDLDGDGTFELQGVNLGEPQTHNFDDVGEYDITVRITGTPADGGPVESDSESIHMVVTAPE